MVHTEVCMGKGKDEQMVHIEACIGTGKNEEMM